MKTVSEQDKAKALLTLTKEDVGGNNYNFIQVTIKNKLELGILDALSEKQQKWFDDLYRQNFQQPEVFQQRQGKFNPKDDEGY